MEATGAPCLDRSDPGLSPLTKGDDGRRGSRAAEVVLIMLLVDIDFSWPRLGVESTTEGLGELLRIRDIGRGLEPFRLGKLPPNVKAVIELCMASRLIGLPEGLAALGVLVFDLVIDSVTGTRSSASEVELDCCWEAGWGVIGRCIPGTYPGTRPSERGTGDALVVRAKGSPALAVPAVGWGELFKVRFGES